MEHKGKLQETKFNSTTTKARCYTCVYHDRESMELATMVRVRIYKNRTENVYFCQKHAQEAFKSDIFNLALPARIA